MAFAATVPGSPPVPRTAHVPSSIIVGDPRKVSKANEALSACMKLSTRSPHLPHCRTRVKYGYLDHVLTKSTTLMMFLSSLV